MADDFLNLEFSLGENDAAFAAAFQKVAVEAVQQVLREAQPAVRRRVMSMVDVRVRQQKEWESLVGGSLRELLGVADAASVLEKILEVIVQHVEVRVLAPERDSLGGYRVGILQADFRDILSVSGTSYVSHSAPRFRKGEMVKPSLESVVDWLDWLLFRGDSIILDTVEVNTARAKRKASRTGRAIMIHPKRREPAGFAIPSEFSGIQDNNFLTRALNGAEEEVRDIISSEIKFRT